MVAQRTGVRMMAIMKDNVIDETMVMENCLKIAPVEPDIKAIGTKTGPFAESYQAASRKREETEKT